MKLKPIGSNKTELETENMNGMDLTVFFSYGTPVACLDRATGEYYRTKEKHSATTTKHINSWLAGVVATPLPQTFFDKGWEIHHEYDPISRLLEIKRFESLT